MIYIQRFRRISYLNILLIRIQNFGLNSYAVKQKSKKKKDINFSPLTFIIDDFKVLVGKNNKQNDYLTLKYAKKNDIWLHTKDIHGSHVIIETNGLNPSFETIKSVAIITAKHSQAKFSSKVPVDYTQVKYVKKPSGSKPGMVIYTNYKTIYVNLQNDLESED